MAAFPGLGRALPVAPASRTARVAELARRTGRPGRTQASLVALTAGGRHEPATSKPSGKEA